MGVHVVALVSGLGWHVQDLQRASERLDCRFTPVPFSKLRSRLGSGKARFLAGSHDLDYADGVLVRMMPAGTLEQVVYRMDLLHRLEAAGRRVINGPRAIEAAVDKFLSLARMEARGLPIPETWVGESASDAMEAFEAMGGDVVVKPLFGSEGRGLMRVQDRELARRVFWTLERLGAVLYVQKFAPNDGTDYRVFVVDGRALGVIRRHAASGEWRANVAVGGRAERVTLEPESERLAVEAAEAVGARVAGVDLLDDRSQHRRIVLEVNAVPGWRAFASVTEIDVASEIVKLFLA